MHENNEVYNVTHISTYLFIGAIISNFASIMLFDL